MRSEPWPDCFSQLMEHLPRYEFQKCVGRYHGDHQQKSFSCWDQEPALYQILQILSLTLFEKTPILQALRVSDSDYDLLDASNKLILVDC